MLPEPLHPAVTHLPMALAIALPIVAGWALIPFPRTAVPERRWRAVILLAVLLAGTSWMAVQSGEREEDVVERFVAEELIEEHEEWAERFLFATGIGVVLSALGLITGPAGKTLRILFVVYALALFGVGVRVGHLGGELVYKHGAANAYTTPSGTPPPTAAREYDD